MRNNKNNMLFAALIAGVSFLAGASGAQASTLDDIQERGELRVAIQTQGAPFSIINRNGDRTGSSVELAKLMAKEMGVKIAFLDVDWDGLLPALISGKADLLAADMTPTLARATKVAFTKPWLYVGAVAVIKEGGQYNSLDDCKKPGMKVAVMFGSSAEKVSENIFPEAEIKAYKGAGTMLLDALKTGRVDCAVNDSSSVAAQVSGYPSGTFKVLPEMLSKEPLAFATRYESLDLLTWLNLFIDQTTLDGRLQQNLDYWVNSTQWKEDD